ncbi:LOW QUALITY PROTEIN: piggyBac transposable element-derived protein 4-like [Amphiura filiformis]|uniref:LOW QUALITY PROTEIN: piggyBac transposable element-derived protein 4-like n=1 Tax=Amphiura filiformis TaxID=82378 RepID=UPI003B220091
MDLGMKSVISKDRFVLVMRFLHCVDNTQAAPRNHVNYDHLQKRGLVDIAVGSWQEQFYPRREISGGETNIPFKRNTLLNGYNPQKPHKWGLTIWSLADAVMGTCMFTIGTYMKVRVHMIRAHRIITSTDNYFTSPILFEDLATRQTGACGTLRRNRTGTPDVIKHANPKKTDPTVVAKSGEDTFFSWQDRNLVTVISTIHTEETFVKRTQCTDSETGWQEREEPKAI